MEEHRANRIPGFFPDRAATFPFVLPILAGCADRRTRKYVCYHRIFWSGRWDSNPRPQPTPPLRAPDQGRHGARSSDPLAPERRRRIHRAPADADIGARSSWTPAQRGATVLCQFHLSGWELDQTARVIAKVEWHSGELFPRVGSRAGPVSPFFRRGDLGAASQRYQSGFR